MYRISTLYVSLHVICISLHVICISLYVRLPYTYLFKQLFTCTASLLYMYLFTSYMYLFTCKVIHIHVCMYSISIHVTCICICLHTCTCISLHVRMLTQPQHSNSTKRVSSLRPKRWQQPHHTPAMQQQQRQSMKAHLIPEMSTVRVLQCVAVCCSVLQCVAV